MKIYAPNKEYTGFTASVPFVNGVGETDDEYLINYLLSVGYKKEEIKDEEKNEEIPNYKKFIKVELEELLDELNIEYDVKSTNDDKIALLDEYYGVK